MMTMGTTISLAGKPNINAISINPSRPISRANGSKKFAQCARRLKSPAWMLASTQITRPAGAATITARPSTKSVLSNIDRTMVLPTCGLR